LRLSAYRYNRFRSTIFVTNLVCILTLSALAQKITYPETKTDNVVDFYNGQKVFDRYRWLEDMDSPETRKWAETQNALTRSYLDTIPYRQAIENRLDELYDLPRRIMPTRCGGRYFYFKYPKDKNQYALFMRDSLNGDTRIVLDPGNFGDSGTVAITAWAVSHDGRLLAYALSYGGSDWQEVHIYDIDRSKNYNDVLKYCKFVKLAWTPDDSALFYARWPEPGMVKEEYKNNKLYRHKIGTSQDADSLIYEVSSDKEADLLPYITGDQRYLMLPIYFSSSGKLDLYYLEFGKSNDFKRLLHNEPNYFNYVDNIGSTFYFSTGLKAPGGKIVVVDVDSPGKKREVVPSQDLVLDYAIIADNRLVVAYMDYVYHKLEILDLDGKYIKDVELPALGTVYAMEGDRRDSTILLGFESFVYPPTTYIYNFNSGEIKPFDQEDLPYDLSPYVTRQVVYKSFGGVDVPMFLTFNKNLPLDGQAPTILNGYGGFGISMMPHYSSHILMWLENGGVYAVANIRGGGEFGRSWHWAGWGPYKQTSFDDFANAAKWLIKGKITNPSKLVIWGASNGGLLTAVCMEQNPRLFGAVICQVPVTDMLRFSEFTVGKKWINEYGDPNKDAKTSERLLGYSPVHRVSHWDKYPPVLVTAGENDDRVPPLHAYKFVAALQSEDDGIYPKLLRLDIDAGHGQGKPLNKMIEEQTDIYTFIFKSLGITPKMLLKSD
jgi:prolyl oligopeptidase